MSELDWAAGFFEGEGYVGVVPANKTGSRRLVLSVVQVDRPCLDRFRDAVGLGRVNGPYGEGEDRRKPYWSFSKEGSGAQTILELIMPFMTPGAKLEQCRTAIYELDVWRNRPTCDCGAPMTVRTDGSRFCSECKKLSALRRWGATHEMCAKGHERTPENRTPRGECRPCVNERQNRRRRADFGT